MSIREMNRSKTKRNTKMKIFNTEYVPELEWTMIEVYYIIKIMLLYSKNKTLVFTSL